MDVSIPSCKVYTILCFIRVIFYCVEGAFPGKAMQKKCKSQFARSVWSQRALGPTLNPKPPAYPNVIHSTELLQLYLVS